MTDHDSPVKTISNPELLNKDIQFKNFTPEKGENVDKLNKMFKNVTTKQSKEIEIKDLSDENRDKLGNFKVFDLKLCRIVCLTCS